MKNRIIIMCALAAVALLSSCSKMNDLHQPYLDKGEKVYAAKVDSVKAFIGVDSQVLDIYLPSQRVAKGLITWNLGADSLEFDVPESGNLKTVTITGLSEGNYTYEIYTYDKFGNISLPFELTSNVVSQATLDNKIEVACKSFYYRKLGETGLVVSRTDAKIDAAQANEKYQQAVFLWKTDVPGATVHIRYQYQKDDGTLEWKTVDIDGNTIKSGAWFWDLTDAMCFPAETYHFFYWTTYPESIVQQPISTTIDLGPEYVESIRYFEYSDVIDVKIDAYTSAETEDIW